MGDCTGQPISPGTPMTPTTGAAAGEEQRRTFRAAQSRLPPPAPEGNFLVPKARIDARHHVRRAGDAGCGSGDADCGSCACVIADERVACGVTAADGRDSEDHEAGR